MNIDGGRIGQEIIKGQKAGQGFNNVKGFGVNTKQGDEEAKEYTSEDVQGRFPANILLDEEAAEILDEQSGELNTKSGGKFKAKGAFPIEHQPQSYNDKGGASRFFYVAKASRAERNMGLEGFEGSNVHPTVKPLKLMRYLVKITSTPTGGVVLDPFMGSGTTGMACKLEGREFIGIEKDEEYCKIAEARIAAVDRPLL